MQHHQTLRAPVALKSCERAFVVNTHQATVGGDIGREDGSQSPFARVSSMKIVSPYRDAKTKLISRLKSCLPMASGCQFVGAATSVRRRFLGSSQASEPA
jgi:hypothetical protein